MPATDVAAGRGALALLTGPDAHGLLAAAVGAAGGELVSWTARQVDHRPTGTTTVSYRARVRWADGERDETLAAATGGRLPSGAGTLRLADGEREVAVWRFPVDPALPGLAAACDERALTELLTSFGVAVAGPLRLATRSYRPGRRAVIEVRTSTAALVIKAVRPSKVEDLQHRHRLLHDAGVPVPRSLGWTADGLVVMERLAGTSVRDRLMSGSPLVPRGADVLRLLDRLPPGVVDLPRRAPWSEHAQHYADVVGAALPAEHRRACDLAAAVRSTVLAGAGRPAEPTHGDLYETQVLVDGATITGLLDVDTAGPGRQVDDLACALAHLSVLTLVRSREAAAIRRVGAAWLAAFEARCDPLELRHRVAGVLLSLATGPHRVQDTGWQLATTRRLDLVEQWVSSGDRATRPQSASG